MRCVKRPYPSREDAEEAVRMARVFFVPGTAPRAHQQRPPRWAYYCNNCSRWHTTSQEK